MTFLHGSDKAREFALGKLRANAQTLRRGYKESQGDTKARDECFDTERNIQAGSRFLAGLATETSAIVLVQYVKETERAKRSQGG